MTNADDAVAASGQSANGSAGLKPDNGTLIGQAAAEAVAARLGPMLGNLFPQLVNMIPQLVAQGVAQGMAQVLQQVPVRTQRMCKPCLAIRLTWESQYKAEMDAAHAAAMAVNGIAGPADPRAAQLDLTAYLPDHLKPGSGTPRQMPQIADAVTMAGGDEVCPMHVPGTPQQAGRRGLLLPPPGMPVGVAVRMLSGGPGMPG